MVLQKDLQASGIIVELPNFRRQKNKEGWLVWKINFIDIVNTWA